MPVSSDVLNAKLNNGLQAKVDSNKDAKTGRFLPGNSGYNGRPKGSRNKLSEHFLAGLERDFAEHGQQAIETVREKRPHEYLKVIASLMPRDVNLNVSAVERFGQVIEAIEARAKDVTPDNGGTIGGMLARPKIERQGSSST